MKKKIQEYLTYLTAEYIYIPYDKEELLSLPKDKYTYNNSCLGTLSNGKKIFSPVSGKIIGISNMEYSDSFKNCLVIENDFIDRREKLNPTRNINKLKKSEITESLEKYNLNKKINSKTTLVVNSFYDKNTDLKDMVINYESYEEILEAIDEFMNIFNMKTCYISIPNNDIVSTSSYEKYINAFPNICIIHSNNKFKDSTCVFYTVEEILAIYKAIHLDYMYDSVMFTICSSEHPIIVKVKLYTALFEILRALKVQYRGKKVYVNGKEIKSIKSFVIDSYVRSILIKE